MLAPVKAANPGMQIAVGGCLAQKDRETILKKAPWVDAVFGTHNVGALPALLDRARHNNEAQLEILESLDVFPSTLPTKRDSVYSGWVSISVGCNNTCTFCIVPALRGKEKDRRPGDILAEIQALVDDGAIEVTLLGQNVNSYGVEFGDRQAFSKLLRACGEIEGLERVRFTSPHPAAFTDDVIDAMAETPNVMPQLHMPLQSGSDKVLKDMKRSYRSTQVPGHPGQGPGADPARRHLHGHHRRLPGRDRGGLPGHPGRRGEVPVRHRLHLPVLQAARHAGRRPAGPAAQGRGAGTLRTAHGAAGPDRRGRERAAAGPPGGGHGHRAVRAEGRRNPPAVRPFPGPAAGALLRSGRGPGPAARRPRHRHHHRGRAFHLVADPAPGGLQPAPLPRGRRLGPVPG